MKKPIDLTYPRKFIAVKSSYTPASYHYTTFNDLAALHASRSATGMFERMRSAMKEITNNQ
jgi:hypothetical protein